MTSGAVQSSKACPGPDPGFKVPGYGLGTRNAELWSIRGLAWHNNLYNLVVG